MNLEEFCNVNPRVEMLPEYDMGNDTPWCGIKALFYDGADYKSEKTKVFAHIGFPKMSKGEKVPAVVLVHGGGGHTFPEWIRLWNERGFAAIAMDTTGFVPKDDKKGTLGTETSTMAEDYVHELYGNLASDGYTTGPTNVEMKDYDLPVEEQWMYHAVADTILAHNLLINDERVDSDKIGIVGISWGSVIASIAIGYDTRYAFAIPIYGSAYLDSLPAPMLPRVFREEKVKELWSAADRLNRANMPILWKIMLYDVCFTPIAASRSYEATRENGAVLSMGVNMQHSHVEGWIAVEPYRFAKGVVEGREALIKPISSPCGFEHIEFQISVPEDFASVSASLYYMTEPLEYGEDNKPVYSWKSAPAEINGNKVSCDIPSDALRYFVEISGVADGTEYVSDTEIVER